MIRKLYYILFFLTPLLVSSASSELFELPKMYIIYALTGLITGAHLINFFNQKKPFFTPSPIFLPVLLFLGSQFLSFLFSVDQFTSFYGYYGRFDGGLLSTICFSLLVLIYPSYANHPTSKTIIKLSIFAGFLVSLYAIAQHFGIDAHIWQQDVQARVFSTLGQPNWLAAYMCILVPLTFLVIKSPLPLTLLLSTQLVTILFTKSQSGLLACGLSLLIILLSNIKKPSYWILLIGYGLLIILIPNPIQDKLLSFGKASQPIVKPETGEVLNITPSGDIRNIVWKGALDIVRAHPLLGTGPETFAQSYYLVRPRIHNDTSEWNFLYNKAHNEYLNIAANTGLIGFLAYLVFIVSSLTIFLHKKSILILASFASILVTNYFGFSISLISLYFFFLPLLWHENS